MAEISNFLSIFQNPIVIKIFIALIILLIGFILTKLAGRGLYSLIATLWGSSQIRKSRSVKYFINTVKLIIILLTIVAALSYLNIKEASTLTQYFWNITPNIIGFVLILFIGVLIVNIIVNIIHTILNNLSTKKEAREIGLSAGLINTIMLLIKIIFYVIVLSLSFSYLGIPIPFLDHILIAVSYGFVFLAMGIFFYAYKDPISNFLLHSYVGSNVVKPGQYIKFGDVEGEVVSITPYAVVVETVSGYNVLIPHREIINRLLKVQRGKEEIRQIENLRKGFIAQKPGYEAIAAVSMLLSFFGFHLTQQKIAKAAGFEKKGIVSPSKIIDEVKKASNSQIKGVELKYEDVFDLASEAKSWIAEDALLLLWFRKPGKPEAENKGNYAVCVGTEGEELVLLDLGKSGGTFLVAGSNIKSNYSVYRKKGFIVFAKKGSPAYWRLAEKLYYSDAELYPELTKSGERYLKKLEYRTSKTPNIFSKNLPSFKR